MKYEATCPIWGTPASMRSIESTQPQSVPYYPTAYYVESRRIGGKYSLTTNVYQIVSSNNFGDFTKAKLTTWIVDQRRFGVECPHITDEILESILHRKPLPVQERANRLLKLISNRTLHIGYPFYYYPQITSDSDHDIDEMLAITESINRDELGYLFNLLKSSNFLDDSESSHDRFKYIIMPHGYAHLSELETRTIESSQAFVAMWFDQTMSEAYEKGIEPAIRQAGYEPVRIDGKLHNNKIDDEIISEIRRSRFLVADFTQGKEGARGGVYYEAGFAHGLNIPVIFTCSKATLSEVHFDTRQYNHIDWEDHDDLNKRLTLRITATIGEGPLKKVR